VILGDRSDPNRLVPKFENVRPRSVEDSVLASTVARLPDLPPFLCIFLLYSSFLQVRKGWRRRGDRTFGVTFKSDDKKLSCTVQDLLRLCAYRHPSS
jgi:hypothetical protein